MILGQLKGLAVAELLILMYLKTSVAIKRERGRKWQTDLPCVSARPGRWNRGQTCPHEPPFPWTGLTVLQGRCRGFESEALTALIFLCSPSVCVCVCVCMLSCIKLCDPMDGNPSGSLKFSRQVYWRGLPFPPPGDLSYPGIEPLFPVLVGGFFTIESARKWQL